ncbi:MAG: hypothetical protein SFX73_34985 [Kofleriaceae bacterium]|nr:hypothetical protein [Kofleriaceae bacterium]
MRLRFSFLLLALALPQLGATDCGGITRDPGFDLWCGDELCAWKTVRGEIRRAPTWHEKDAGVELLGPDAAIAQLTPVTSYDATCIRFDLVANVEESAEVMVGIDVFGDGQIEREERIPTATWKPVSFKVPIEGPYSGIRFEIAKRGTGRAVIAQVEVVTAPDECVGLEPAPNHPAPLGSSCNSDDDCASNMCRRTYAPGSWFGMAMLCVGCDPLASACGVNEVCGVDDAFSPVQFPATTCIPAGSRELGEQCGKGVECASGVCNNSICSTCSSNVACANGERCGGAWEADYAPFVCSPGQGVRASGEPCGANADCASGRCNGAVRKQCSDGRPCSSPAQCPSDGVENGACEEVGIQGGSCQ